MSKYEDEAMELIETVAKPFERGAMPKGQLIDTKSAETWMLPGRLNIRNGSEGLTLVSL